MNIYTENQLKASKSLESYDFNNKVIDMECLDLETKVVYIYDIRKKHGFYYDPEKKIYIAIDKIYCQKYNPKIIFKDLRPHLDELPINHIPICQGLLLNCITKETTIRNQNDLISYELPCCIQQSKSQNNVKFTVAELMERLCPQYLILQHYLNLFIRGLGPPCICVKGSTQKLFDILLLLKPIVQIGNPWLYSQTHARKKMVESISQARIILVDIKDKTLRIANNTEFGGLFPIQYRGIVSILDSEQIKKDQNETRIPQNDIPLLDILNITTYNDIINIDAGDLLAWILKY